MAKMDTKPFESAQAALFFFEQKLDKNKYSSTSNGEKEKEVDLLMKELANCKMKLEIKEYANLQAVCKVEDCLKTIEELSTKLKHSESDREKCMEESKKAETFIFTLKSGYQVITSQLIGSLEYQEELLQALDELKPMSEELLELKAKVSAVRESKVAALRNTELVKKDLGLGNAKIDASNLADVGAETGRSAFFSGMEADLQTATVAVGQLQKQLEEMEKHLDMMHELQNELLKQTILTDYFQCELKQAKELHGSQMMPLEKMSSKGNDYNICIVDETKSMQEELPNAREAVDELDCQTKALSSEISLLMDETSKSKETELKLQVELAMLKSELHKGRSRIAAAEAAEARAMNTQARLPLVMQQLVLEAEAAKKEAQRLKLEMCSGITISAEEYETLIQKAKMLDDNAAGSPPKDEIQLLESGNRCEVDILKEELEVANAEISELKSTLEETVRKAELAEKAKAAVEGQLRKWREQQQQRRAASEALNEQRCLKVHSSPPVYQPPPRSTVPYDEKHFNYVPLDGFSMALHVMSTGTST